MKRYVTEFVNDALKKVTNIYDIATIRSIVDMCKQGYITDAEAVYQISKLYLGIE